MKAMYELRDMLCRELDELAGKGDLGAGDLDIVYKLASAVKNLYKIEMLEDGGYSRDDGYSRGGNWEADLRGNYGRDSSYSRRGTHYVRGHYSRDGGDSYSDGYSRHESSDMASELRELMSRTTDDRVRNVYRRALDEMEKM